LWRRGNVHTAFVRHGSRSVRHGSTSHLTFLSTRRQIPATGEYRKWLRSADRADRVSTVRAGRQCLDPESRLRLGSERQSRRSTGPAPEPDRERHLRLA